MAQTGYTPIQLYYSSTTTNVPLAANLAYGELAINITDGKLFYKDNANAIQVIGWKVVPATAGGTGQTSYAVGDLIYANTTTTLAKLADVATGNALISGGVNTAPSWGKIGLTTHVSGTLPTANGGTNLTSFTANGVMYASSSSALTTGIALTFNGNAVEINVASQVPYFIARTNADGSNSPQGGLQWYENNSGQVTASITGFRGGGAYNQTNMVFSTADGGANTERARFIPSGNFLLGTSSASTGGVTMAAVLDARTINSGYGLGVIGNSSNTQIMRFAYDTTAVGSIVISGATTTYNTISDQDLKNDLGVVTETDVIANTVIHDYTWKTNGDKARGPFAQEAHTVNPHAVTVGNDELDENGNKINPWQIDLSKYIPDIIVELQSLRKRVAELEAKG